VADDDNQSGEAVYALVGDRAIAGVRAAGPWDAAMQHGGAPSALLAAIVEATPSAAPMQIARMSVDLLRPVPLGALRVSSEIVREGRNIQLVEASLHNGDKLVVAARALRIRAQSIDVTPSPAPSEAPAPDICAAETAFGQSGFGSNMEVRRARGEVRRGKAALWFRMRTPLIDGSPLTGVVRAMAASDFGNGISMTLDFARFTFINADLTVHLWREPIGAWILVDAETQRGDAGRALTETRLADERGYFGRAAQSLVVSPR